MENNDPDPFRGKEPDNLYDFFGGCIGLAVPRDREKLKKDLYGDSIQNHVQKYKTNYIDVINVWKVNTSARLYQMIPKPNTLHGHKRVWLTKTVEDVIKYEFALLSVHNLYNRSGANADASKVDQGCSFEKFFAHAWLLKNSLKIKIYTNYGQEKWAEKADCAAPTPSLSHFSISDS